jgi:hypothetical protein
MPGSSAVQPACVAIHLAGNLNSPAEDEHNLLVKFIGRDVLG